LSVNLLKYWEHCGFKKPFLLNEEHSKLLLKDNYLEQFSKKRNGKDVSQSCFEIKKKDDNSDECYLNTGYFIGLDWVDKEKTALFVAPKLNEKGKEVDYIKMLFSSLRHSDVSKEINELFVVKWDEPVIEIEQKNDLLTPFLVVEFLSLLKTVVRKGLKKSYYKVEQNLHSKVKGKILVAKSIKHNLLQNKNLHTYCSYDEFGLNNKENRLLKKALSFVKRYLPNYTQLFDFDTNNDLQNTFNFINPAFYDVSDVIELNEIKHSKTNAFYKEYEPAIRLAKIILKRFGYNISNTVKDKIQTPPFWIDMSKLFELYVLALLKERFNNNVEFQYKVGRGNELDFLLKEPGFEMVIDAKYKPKWKEENGIHDDVRQVSGYSRLKKVYDTLGFDNSKVVEALIIYPDLEIDLKDLKDDKLIDKRIELREYNKIYKLGINLPQINN